MTWPLVTVAAVDGRESPVSPHDNGTATPLLAPPSPAASPTPFANNASPRGAPPAASATGAATPPAVGGSGMTVTVESCRLEGVILRSQLLVLLQRRHFCDQHGRPVGREYNEKQEIELEVCCCIWSASGPCLDPGPHGDNTWTNHADTLMKSRVCAFCICSSSCSSRMLWVSHI